MNWYQSTVSVNQQIHHICFPNVLLEWNSPSFRQILQFLSFLDSQQVLLILSKRCDVHNFLNTSLDRSKVLERKRIHRIVGTSCHLTKVLRPSCFWSSKKIKILEGPSCASRTYASKSKVGRRIVVIKILFVKTFKKLTFLALERGGSPQRLKMLNLFGSYLGQLVENKFFITKHNHSRAHVCWQDCTLCSPSSRFLQPGHPKTQDSDFIGWIDPLCN